MLVSVLVGCNQNTGRNGECVIKGTVVNKDLEGKRIFLVPMFGPQDAAHVDSIEIRDGKFEFRKDTVMMAKIVMDYHYRFNTQTLLVATEPGTVEVVIDTVSSAKGTPQNDALQRWKEMTEVHNAQLRVRSEELGVRSEGVKREERMRGDSIRLAYKQQSRKLAADMEDGVVKDFISGMFPLTYKRKMPDGSLVEIDADTNEPVKKMRNEENE